MRKLTNLLILFILTPVISFSQVKSKVWYDGNSRAMFYRDAQKKQMENMFGQFMIHMIYLFLTLKVI